MGARTMHNGRLRAHDVSNAVRGTPLPAFAEAVSGSGLKEWGRRWLIVSAHDAPLRYQEPVRVPVSVRFRGAECRLTLAQQARKRGMVDCYTSQAAVLVCSK